MADHVHDWSIDHQIIDVDGSMPVGEVFAYCGCGEELGSDDIFRRVNATERFKGRDARGIADNRLLNIGDLSMLKAYAAALEGEDGK